MPASRPPAPRNTEILGRTLWGVVRGGPEVEAEIREGKHDEALPELHEMAIRHAGPGLIGAIRDRLLRLQSPLPEPQPELTPAQHPEVKPWKPTTKAKTKGKG